MAASARLALIAPGILVAALVAPVHIATQQAAAQPAVAAPAAAPSAATCEALEVGGACHFTYSQFPNGAAVAIPSSLDAVTVVVSGASGAAAARSRVDGGQGGMVVAVVDVDHSAGPLTIQLGQQGDGRTGGVGWSHGGDGGRSHGGRYGDGGAGGGSSAVGWAVEWPNHPFIVAGGGGGGGGNVGSDNPIPVGGGGGPGGTGGKPAGDGSDGSRPRAGNGAGGDGNGASGNNGDAGGSYDIEFDNSTAAGGGGGGGFHSGGAGGEIGLIGNCKINGKCPPDGAPGAGGGGGGGETFVWSKLPSQGIWYGVGSPGDGSVTVLAGTPVFLGCVDSTSPRTFDIPADVTGYGFIAAGGAGASGHNSSGSEGHGASVSGVLDVTGMDSLQYWVGCSAYHHDGKGYGKPGGGGDAPEAGNKDGGWGGGASLVTDASGNALFAAGGGGGSGGDFSCVEDVCVDYGGEAGNGGGVNGSNDRFGGEGGGGYSGFGGDGGCGGCNGSKDNPDPNGTHGGHAKGGGGGGGGGAGFPRGGDGGEGSEFAGGGGGAGASYVSSSKVTDASIGTNAVFESGFILLIPITAAETTLTVTKQVTGTAASYATGPFTMAVDCTINGTSVYTGTFSLGVSDSHTIDGLPVGAACTVTEADAAGATVPAPPQTVTLVKARVTVTMVNTFTASSILVDLASVIASVGPNPGVAIELGTLSVAVACTFQGHPITLSSGSTLGFTGQDTWAAGGQAIEITGVPIGAVCTLSENAGSGATDTSYTVDGTLSPDPSATLTVGAAQGSVDIVDTYQLAPLVIDKAASGTGTPPIGATYTGAVSCTFQDRPVTLPASTFDMSVGATTWVENLPVGAQCTVDETDRGEATAVTYAPSATVEIAQPTSPVTMTVTNQFSAEPLTVAVSNRGAGSRWANEAYQVTLLCTGTADQVLDFPAAGGTQTVDVDAGAECSIGSVNDTGQAEIDYASSTDPTWQTTPPTVTIPDGPGAALEVSNLFTAAPLDVISTTEGAATAYANTDTTVSVTDCTFNGQPIDTDASFTFGPHGGTASIPLLPTSATCAAAQTTSGGATTTTFAVANGAPDTVGSTGVELTVNQPVNGARTTVDVTNTFDLGGLTVTVDISGAAAWAANLDVVVAVTCSFNGRAVATLGPQGAAVLTYSPQGVLQPSVGATAIGSLPIGAECTATEPQSGGATTVAFDPAGSPVSQSGPVRIALGSTIGVTNTFDATTYRVVATVSGNDADNHTTDLFFYEQSCRFNDQPIEQPQTTPAWASVLSLSATQSISYSGLPVGALCTIDEFDTAHATQVLPSLTQQAVLTADGSVLTFDNVFDVAPVTIAQILEGDGAAVYGQGKTFDELISCTYADGSKADIPLPNRGWFALSPANDYTATFPVPVGAVCVIDQPDEQMATALDLSGPIVVAGSTSTAQPVVATATAGVLATSATANVLTATDVYMLGGLIVSKSVSGPAPAAATYDFGLTCSFGGQPVPVADPVSGTFAIAAGQTYAAAALSGAKCTVTETDSQGASSVTVTTASATTDDTAASVELCWCAAASAGFTNAFADAPPTPTPTPSTGSSSTAGVQGGALSVTGSPLSMLAGLGLLLVIAGTVALGAARRGSQRGRHRF